jgi:hypothetical protein
MSNKFTLIVFFNLSLLIFNNAKAQAPNWQWAKGVGGTGYDAGNSTATDAAGNVYVTGDYNTPTITFGAFTLTNTGVGSTFIVKYDASGNVLWAKNGIGGQFMTIDAVGNIILGGTLYSDTMTFGTTTITSTNSYTDIYIVKCDSLGNVLWAKAEGGMGQDLCKGIATDVSGNIYVTGSYLSPFIVFGGDTLINRDTSSTYADMYIVKYDTAGNVSWTKRISGNHPTGNETGFSITTDFNSNVYVIGEYGNINPIGHFIILGTDTLFGYGTFLVKYDALGNEIWVTSPSGNSGINVDAIGNVYVTGTYNSFNSTTFGTTTFPITSNGSDIFVVKYDSLGNVIWAKRAGGSGNDFSKLSAIDADGNFYITGTFYAPSITFGAITLTYTGSGWGDIFVAKYDAMGNVVWAKKAASNAADYVNGICVDLNNNTYITGFYDDALTMSFGSITLTSTSSSNPHFYFAKIGCGAAPVITESSPTTFCNGDSVQLTTNTAGSYLWSNGDTTQTITVNTSGSYSVTNTNGVCSVQSTPTVVTVNQTPSITNVIDSAICGAGAVTLSANATGGTIKWYSTANGGLPLATGTSYTTPTIAATTTYYVDATIGTCTSPIRTAITATIDTLFTSISAMGSTTICAGDSITLFGNSGGTWNTASTDSSLTVNAAGNYFVTTTNSCGSTTSNTIAVIVNSAVTHTDVITACNSYTWVNGTIYTANNNTDVYTYNGGAANGCDSIVTLNLIINNSTIGYDVINACDSYTWIDGNTYTSSNNSATFTLVGANSNGCDSIITLNLTMNSTPNNALTQNINTLTANQSNATYQWLLCNGNYTAISGETNQSFTPTQIAGFYAVAVSQNGCADTSLCINVIINTNCHAQFTLYADTATTHHWYALNQSTGAGTLQYVWSWGDGSANDTTTNPSHTYAAAGYYNICVTINDSAGCTSTYCDSSTYITKSMANTIISVDVVDTLPPAIVTSITKHSISESDVKIYPNPANDKLYIEVSASAAMTQGAKLFDVIGNEISLPYEKRQLSTTNFQFSISNLQLSSGVYFVKVGNEVRRFIKE